MVTDDTLTPTSGVGGGGVHPSSKCILTMHCELACQCALTRCRHCYFNNIPASLDLDIFRCGLHGNKKNRNQNWESRIFLLQFRKGLKYFILIDADNFIKKHFITKEKTDSAHPPPHPGPHCLKSSQDVPWLGWGGEVGATNKIFWDRRLSCTQHSLKCGSSHSCSGAGRDLGRVHWLHWLHWLHPTQLQHWRHWTLGYWELRTNSCQMYGSIQLSVVTGGPLHRTGSPVP